jgi:hypothetical protein
MEKYPLLKLQNCCRPFERTPPTRSKGGFWTPQFAWAARHQQGCVNGRGDSAEKRSFADRTIAAGSPMSLQIVSD